MNDDEPDSQGGKRERKHESSVTIVSIRHIGYFFPLGAGFPVMWGLNMGMLETLESLVWYSLRGVGETLGSRGVAGQGR
jgi:hypothetical protein